MEIKFCCPECNQKLSIDVTYIGENVQCPKCGNYMQVPDIEEISPETSHKRQTKNSKIS